MRWRLVSAGLGVVLAAALPVLAISPAAAQPKHPRAHPVKSVNERDIRIGLLLAGGAYATTADDIAAGLDLAVAEAGRRVDGRHLVVIREDGDGAPSDAAMRARVLAAAGAVDVLVGPATPGEAAALAGIADSTRLPLIMPIPVAAAAKCSPYVFHLVPPNDQLAGLVGSWVAGLKPAKHVYALVPPAAGGHAQVEAFERQFQAAGGEMAGDETVSGSNPEFSPYLAKLRLVGADALYAPFAGAAAKALAADYQALGLSKTVAFIGTTVPTAVDRGIAAADYEPAADTPENRRFRADFARRFGRAPTEHAARGYDAGLAILEALRATRGRIEPAGGFAAMLAQTSFTGPRGPVRGTALGQVYIVRAAARAAAGSTPPNELLDEVMPAAPAAADACHTPARS